MSRSDKVYVGVKGVGVNTTEHVESIKLSDVIFFIEDVKKEVFVFVSKKNQIKKLDELLGDRFKWIPPKLIKT